MSHYGPGKISAILTLTMTRRPGILPVREAIRDFRKRTAGANISVERITIPGGAVPAVTSALIATGLLLVSEASV